MSGRVVGFAVHPEDRSHYFAAVASGGVWKTDNAGVTWTPVFDNEGSYSIGCVTLDPKNPNVVWVGTGENNSQRSVGYGDGVYKSIDGGRTWKNVGLKNSEHIGKILIDPRDSDTVYVAAQGPLWGPGGDRGLYKTTDGGKTWTKILDISENTGVTDIVQDPRNPDMMLAASYQRRRHVYTLVNGGPESAIHRTTDGGKTWTKVRAGLPSADLGRIGLAMAPSEPGHRVRHRRGGRQAGRHLPLARSRRHLGEAQPVRPAGPVLRPPRRRPEEQRPRLRHERAASWCPTTAAGRCPACRNAGSTWTSTTLWIDPRDPNYYLVRLRRRHLRELRPRRQLAAHVQPAGHAVLRRDRRADRHAVLQGLRRHAGQQHARRPGRGT